MADGSAGYFSTLLKYYDSYGDQVLHRWNQAMKDIQDRTYEPKHLLSDALYFWGWGLFGISPLWSVFLAANPFDEPTLSIPIQKGKPTAKFTKKLTSAAPGNSQPSIAALTLKDGNKKLANVTARLSRDRTELTVRITGLNARSLGLGEHYLGDVELEGAPIARVDAYVEPGRDEADE